MSARRRAALLDRDGVLNVDCGYAHRPDQLVFVPGAVEAVRRLNAADVLVLVATNQSGVARGLYDEAAVDAFHAEMNAVLGERGGHVERFYACPYHPEAEVEAYRRADHPDRKPNPGMLLRALLDFGLQPEDAFLIGDKASDIEAADRAGIRGYRFRGGNLDDFLVSVVGRDVDLASRR